MRRGAYLLQDAESVGQLEALDVLEKDVTRRVRHLKRQQHQSSVSERFHEGEEAESKHHGATVPSLTLRVSRASSMIVRPCCPSASRRWKGPLTSAPHLRLSQSRRTACTAGTAGTWSTGRHLACPATPHPTARCPSAVTQPADHEAWRWEADEGRCECTVFTGTVGKLCA